MTDTSFKTKLAHSIDGVERWVESRGYKAYEPFDGLSSYLRPLTFKSLFLERILQQAVRQSPVNLRPLLGIRPQESTKGRGYMAWGYLQRLKATGDRAYWAKAVACLDWLDEHKASGFSTHSWGNHFDFSSRGGKLPKLTPIIVWTSLLGQAYLDAYEIGGEARYLEIAKSVCAWILGVPRERTERGTCLSYVAFAQESVHNSNMLGAAMLARAAKFDHDLAGTYRDVARQAMRVLLESLADLKIATEAFTFTTGAPGARAVSVARSSASNVTWSAARSAIWRRRCSTSCSSDWSRMNCPRRAGCPGCRESSSAAC